MRRRAALGEAGARPALSRNCDAGRSRSGGEVRSPSPPCPTPFARKGKDVSCRAHREQFSTRSTAVGRRALPKQWFGHGCLVLALLALSHSHERRDPVRRQVSLAQEATPGARSESTAMSPVEAASVWLREQQDASGGFLGFSGEPDPGTTTDAVMALFAAQERDPEAAAALEAAVTYLEENGAAYAGTGPGQAAKLALAVVTGGRDPHEFAGMDLVAAMTAPLATPIPDGIAGIYGDDLYDHALVVIALSASGETIPEMALEPFRSAQGEEGGWAFDGSTAAGAADSNTTALVIQALTASGRHEDPMVDRALAFLSTAPGPGWRFRLWTGRSPRRGRQLDRARVAGVDRRRGGSCRERVGERPACSGTIPDAGRRVALHGNR